MRKKVLTKIIMLRLKPETYKRLKKLASGQKLFVSELARILIEQSTNGEKQNDADSI